jgi:hypothetical protein
MDEGEEENSPPPSMVEGKSVSLNNVPAPLILHPNGKTIIVLSKISTKNKLRRGSHVVK